jgi:hypothetical protein
VIVGVGGDKGSPGATTLATTLALVWPGERVLAELDSRGADLPYRLHHASGGPIQERPSIAALAVDTRPGNAAPPLERYAQATTLGVPLIPGELSIRTMANLAPHMPAIAKAAASWRGVMIADLGALLPGNPALALAKAARVTLVTTRSTLEGLSRLVERVEALSDVTGDASRTASPVGVVVVAEPGDAKASVERARRLLAAAGSPAPVVGSLPLDPKGAASLYSPAPSKKLWNSPLARAGRELVDALYTTWPEFMQLAIDQMNRGGPYQPDLAPAACTDRGEQYASTQRLVGQAVQAARPVEQPPAAEGDAGPHWRPPALDWPAPGGQR